MFLYWCACIIYIYSLIISYVHPFLLMVSFLKSIYLFIFYLPELGHGYGTWGLVPRPGIESGFPHGEYGHTGPPGDALMVSFEKKKVLNFDYVASIYLLCFLSFFGLSKLTCSSLTAPLTNTCCVFHKCMFLSSCFYALARPMLSVSVFYHVIIL